MHSPTSARPSQTLCVPKADWSHHRRQKSTDEANNVAGVRLFPNDITECNERGPKRSYTHNEDADLSSDVFLSSEDEKSDHMFFLDDDDDENDDKGTDEDDSKEDYDAIAPYADGFHSSQFSTSEDLDIDSDPDSKLTAGDFAKSLQARLDPLALAFLENAGSSSWVAGRAAAVTSRPCPIPRMVRRSHTSPTSITAQPVERWRHLPVRPLVGPSSGAIMLSSSCPAAFSTRWNDVSVPPQLSQDLLPGCRIGDDGWQDEDADGKRTAGRRQRRYTVCSGTQGMGTAAGMQQPNSRDPSLPLPTGFVPRNRSYSESDVQRLLMREVGRELRRLSDDFAAAHGKGKRLTTVSESTSEQDELQGSEDEV